MPVHMREYSAGLYNLLAYYLSVWLMTTLIMLLPTLLIGLSVYYILDPFDTGFTNYLEYQAVAANMHFLGSCMGYFIGASFETGDLAALFGINFYQLVMISSGILVNLNNANWFYTAFSYAGGLRYGLEQFFRVLLSKNPSKDFAIDYYDFHTEIELNYLMPYAIGLVWLFLGFIVLWV
jgi:hypothetical protein